MKYTTIHSKLRTDINEHLPTLYQLAVEINAKVVIELGVRSGESTIAFLEAMHTTDGHLWSVDVDPCEGAKQKMKRYGLDDRWTFTVLDDISYGMSKWDRTKKADIVFIDTSHEYRQTQMELNVYDQIVRPGGLMILHDTVSRPQGVLKPIREFLDTHRGYRFENLENCCGLGILRKPS